MMAKEGNITKIPAGATAAVALNADERKRLRHAELLLEVSRKLAAIEGLDELLASLVSMIAWELQAERGTLFLNDPKSGELYSVVAQGNFKRRIRILNTAGIAGHVFTGGAGIIVDDAYQNEYFNPEIDQQTGYVTRSMICAPVKTVKGEVIGVAQMLNKKTGAFSQEDLELLEAMTMQAAVTLQGAQFIETMKKSRLQELEFLDMVADLTSELELGTLLRKVMGEATKMLQAERSTLFLNDEKSQELWALVGEGISDTKIRFPNHLGIAGAVFTSGKSVNIPHAYADLRFNPAFDKETGFFTRSILCVPVINKKGTVIGVTQILNKRGGPFSQEDEARLKAFTAQVAIGLENAKLFDDVQNQKNYIQSMLDSMSNGVLTLDEEGLIKTCNAAGGRILRAADPTVLATTAEAFFAGPNRWVMDKIKLVKESQNPETTMDAELVLRDEKISANLTVLPLVSVDAKNIGTMIMLEDISSEKRMKSTMSRYMDPELAARLLADGEELLGGKEEIATVLFSDIRGFTTLTEELGPQGTVSMLNEYFTIMVECIQAQGGMLDKFIGDALMAAFGIPFAHDDDEDRAVRAAISMISELGLWNNQRQAQGKAPVDMGIGLNTDNIVCGNIGSPKRMDYTMIGDGVNLASRLESACKQYGARILISENTFKKLRGTYRIRDIDEVVVKGKKEPVRVFEVLDYHTEHSFPHIMETLALFKEGRALYRQGSWDRASRFFQDALSLHPADNLSRFYLERCRYLRANNPVDWQGIWVMQSK